MHEPEVQIEFPYMYRKAVICTDSAECETEFSVLSAVCIIIFSNFSSLIGRRWKEGFQDRETVSTVK